MDVFLDVLDTFVFDRLYASILPAPNGAGDVGPPSQKAYNQHIGVYIPLEPSEYVDASIWKRDDIVRQAMSLFLVAWYVCWPLSGKPCTNQGAFFIWQGLRFGHVPHR